MEDKMIPFPLRERPKAGFATTYLAYLAIETLKATGRSSRVIYQGERPALPARAKNYELSEVFDEFTLPDEIVRRINILRSNEISIKQILIVHELPPEKPKIEPSPQPKELPAPKVTSTVALPNAPKTVEKPKKDPITLEDIFYGVMMGGVIATLLVGVAIVGVSLFFMLPILAALATSLLASFVPLFVLGAIFAVPIMALMGCGVDPLCIVVLDDEVESWCLIGSWYE